MSIKNRKLLNINSYLLNNNNPVLQASNDLFCENFYREPVNFYDGREFDLFIKSCEKCIRKSMSYSAYIAYLKTEIGLNRCAINGNITDNDAVLEMHHGPIFTLYDYVKIIIDFFLDTGVNISTFTIAKTVMMEHFLNRVQVVMLTKNNHKLVHDDKLVITMNMAWGNIKNFITTYYKYIAASPLLINKIKKYNEKLKSTEDKNNILNIDEIINWRKK